MKILVAAHFPDNGLAELGRLGLDVIHTPDLGPHELPRKITDVGILVVGNLQVTREAIQAAADLQMIIRGGADVSSIDVDAASAAGILVANTPNRDATAVAELMVGMIVAQDRNLVEHAGAMRSGGTAPPIRARGLAGSVLGILGWDVIGERLARRARAMEMKVITWTPKLSPQRPRDLDVEFCAWPREIAQRADIVACYSPPFGADEMLVDGDFVENMQPEARLVHVGVLSGLDQTAVLTAVRERGLKLAVDYYTAELDDRARRPRAPLLTEPGVLATHRLGGDTAQARDAIAAEVIHVARNFLVSGQIRNCVNLMERSPATWQLVLRLRDQVGVLASIMDAIRADGINAEEVVSRVFQGAKAAWCTISLDERPSTEALDAIQSIDGVLHLELRAVV